MMIPYRTVPYDGRMEMHNDKNYKEGCCVCDDSYNIVSYYYFRLQQSKQSAK